MPAASPVPSSAAARRTDAVSAQAVLQRLQAWIQAVLGDVPVSLEAPGRIGDDSRRIGLYLLDLGPLGQTRNVKATPLQFSLRYLVTAWGPAPADVQSDLCELAFAALDSVEVDVDFEPLPAASWAAFGTAPRPSFTLRMPLRKERVLALAPPVRQPPVVHAATVRTLRGIVLGPQDMPLAAARVELPGLGRSTVTDPEGLFRFDGVPADRLRLRVLARGAVQEFDAAAAQGSGDEHLPLRMTLPSP